MPDWEDDIRQRETERALAKPATLEEVRDLLLLLMAKLDRIEKLLGK